jgi:hypothetical protein
MVLPKVITLRGLSTLDIFEHNILIKKIKRYLKKTFFLQNIVFALKKTFQTTGIDNDFLNKLQYQ